MAPDFRPFPSTFAFAAVLLIKVSAIACLSLDEWWTAMSTTGPGNPRGVVLRADHAAVRAII